MPEPTCARCGRLVRRRPMVRPDGAIVHDDCPYRPSLRLYAAHEHDERKVSSYGATY